jgi:hypothetical protein
VTVSTIAGYLIGHPFIDFLLLCYWSWELRVRPFFVCVRIFSFALSMIGEYSFFLRGHVWIVVNFSLHLCLLKLVSSGYPEIREA